MKVVCEIVEIKMLMHELALDEGRDKVLVSSRLAGVQQDVVHVRLHHVGEVGDSRRIRLVVEPRLSAKTWKLYQLFQPLQKNVYPGCVSGIYK